MGEKFQPVPAIVCATSGTLFMYAILKLQGEVPGPGMYFYNQIDYLVMFLLQVLKFAIPISLLVAGLAYNLWLKLKPIIVKKETELARVKECLWDTRSELRKTLEQLNQQSQKIVRLENAVISMKELLAVKEQSCSKLDNSILDQFI